MKIPIVRIAETENNVAQRVSGRRVDSPLTEAGHAMASYTAQLLAQLSPRAVYSGPAARCRETAEYTADAVGLSVEIAEEFQEVDLGDFDGKKKSELRESDAGRAFLTDPSVSQIPGSVESFESAQKKAVARLMDLAEQHREAPAICIFSHGGTMRLILCEMFGIDIARFWDISVSNCGVILLTRREDGSLQFLELLNHMLVSGA